MAEVAFLGLGVMGYPMAGHLDVAGHSVTVWNRSPKKARRWEQQHAGRVVSNIADAVVNADYVMICVGNDDDVYEVVGSALKYMRRGSIIIDHTTVSDTCAKTCYENAHKIGVGFVDAPISGGEVGAVNGQLTIMCGGDESTYQRAKPIMQAYAKAMKYMGPSGAGQLTKMVNQICIAGTLQGLSEAICFAKKSGLNVNEVVKAIGKGAAQSWQMDNRASTMGKGEFDFGFAVDWMRKDLKIALNAGNKNGADLTQTKLVDSYYDDIQKMGGGRWDTSSLIKRIDK